MPPRTRPKQSKPANVVATPKREETPAPKASARKHKLDSRTPSANQLTQRVGNRDPRLREAHNDEGSAPVSKSEEIHEYVTNTDQMDLETMDEDSDDGSGSVRLDADVSSLLTPVETRFSTPPRKKLRKQVIIHGDTSARGHDDTYSYQPVSEDEEVRDVEIDPEAALNTLSAAEKGELIKRLLRNDPSLGSYMAGVQSPTASKLPKTDKAQNKSQKQPKRRPSSQTVQTNIDSAVIPDAKKFNGSTSCLDYSLWSPALRRMYRELEPPPRIVKYSARTADAMLVPPSFQKWTSCTEQFQFMIEILRFRSNKHYVNPARVKYSDLTVLDTGNVKPFRYLTVKDLNSPALFISLVQVVQCNLLKPVYMQKKFAEGWLAKKGMVANVFQQELELIVCTLGCVLEYDTVTLPSWSGKDDLRGLSFQTRLSNTDGPTGSRKSKPGLYEPAPAPGGALQVQIAAVNAVPVLDASVSGFDLGMPFQDLRRLPCMKEEAPVGSLGVVFYTISDEGPHSPLNFNVQAFALLASEVPATDK